MPKINKNTLKVLPRNNIRIYKFENKQTYFCSFYVGTIHFKSGKFERSTKTKNINQAISKANELYRNWFIENPSTLTKKHIDFDLDIAQPFIRYRVSKYKLKSHLKKNDQGERDKAKWEHFLKPFFDDVDYNDTEMVENIINDQIVTKLKEEDYSGNTINKYMSFLNQMFKRAKDRGVIKVIPDTPTLEVLETPRLPYTHQELNLINRKCDDEYRKKEDFFFLELKDYLNLTRSAGFRPGLEVLNIKKSHYKLIVDAKDDRIKVLEFTLYNTKTKPTHKLTCNPYFTQMIFPEIENRNPNLKDNDYLLFPEHKDRQKLNNKIGKIFIRLSKELGFYYKENGTRPLYSIRHTYATELYKKGVSLDDIATLMNTSVKMLLKTYLGLSDQTLVDRHKRIYPNFRYNDKKLKLIK